MTGPTGGSGATDRAGLVVDWTRCDGHGLCAAVAPAAVVLDPWGYPVLAAPPPGAAGRAAARTWRADSKRAASVCPALALRLERR